MALADVKSKLLNQNNLNNSDIKAVQNLLNETIKATMSTNEMIRQQATKELSSMKGIVVEYGKGLGKFQQQVVDNLERAIIEAEAKQSAVAASSMKQLAGSIMDQAKGLSRTVLNEYARRNPLVYTGMKLFDSLSNSMKKNDKTTKPLAQKQAELIDLQLEEVQEQKKQIETEKKERNSAKKGEGPLVSRMEKLNTTSLEQVDILKEIYSIVKTGDVTTTTTQKPVIVKESPSDEKESKLTRKQLADLNKETRKQTKLQKTAERHALIQAKAASSLEKIEKERLQDEAKAALLEKSKLEDEPTLEKAAPAVDTKSVDSNIMGQVFAGTFLGELVEHIVGKTLNIFSKGMMGAVTGLFKSGGGRAVAGLAGTVVKRVLLPLTVGIAAWDGWKRATDDKKLSLLLNKEAKDIDMVDRVVAGVTGFASSIIGGTIDSITSIFGVDFNIEGKMNDIIMSGYKGIIDYFTNIFDFSGIKERLGRDTSFGEKVFASIFNALTSTVGLFLGVFDSVFDTKLRDMFQEMKDSFLATMISWKDKVIEFFHWDNDKAQDNLTQPSRRDDVINWNKPKAEVAVNEAKKVEAKANQATVNSNATAVNQVSQKTNINNNVFQNKNISPRNTDETVRILSYR